MFINPQSIGKIYVHITDFVFVIEMYMLEFNSLRLGNANGYW